MTPYKANFVMLLFLYTALRNHGMLTRPRAKNEWVCISGRQPLIIPSGRNRPASLSNTARRSRYRQGKSTLQPNSVALWGTSISAITFTQRTFSPTRFVGVS